MYVHMYVKCSLMFERMKRKENKEWKEKSTVKHEKVGNIEECYLWFLFVYLKQSKTERKLMATYY